MRQLYRIALVLLLTTLGAQAQNIQLHYDFGRQLYSKEQPDRPKLTTTVELFRPGQLGEYLLLRRYELSARGHHLGLLGDLS